MIPRTRAEAARMVAVQTRQRAVLEKWSTPKIRKELDLIAKKIGEPTDYQQAIESSVEPMAETLYGLYEKAVLLAKTNAKRTGKAHRPDMETKADDLDEFTTIMLEQFRDYAYTQSQIITETIGQDMARWLAQEMAPMQEAGYGPMDVARAMRKHMDDLSPYKSELIARTETLTSTAKAQDDFASNEWDEDEDGPLYKQWLATSDARTRDTHKAMHMVVVKKSEKFKLPDGAEMAYPGDSAGGPENVCQCRCTVSYLPEELVSEADR